MSKLTLLILVSFLINVLYLFYAFKGLKQVNKFSLLIITNIFIHLRLGVGLPFYHFFPNLWVVDFSEVAKIRGSISMIIVSAFAFLFQVLLLKQTKQVTSKSLVKNKLFLLAGFFAFVFALIGQLYFLLIKGNIAYLVNAVREFANPATHYSYRTYITQSLYATGRGQYASYLSLFLFGPLAITLLAIYQVQSRNKMLQSLWGGLILIEIVSALIHGQRSPLVYYMLLWVMIIYFVKKRNDFETWVLGKNPIRRGIYLALLMVSIAAVVYMITNQSGPLDGFITALWRIFVVTSVAPLYFYELFPEPFHFRGLYGMLFIGDRFNPHADLTYADLGRVLQGAFFNPNAGYFAVAYSGLGFAGVILTVILVNFLCFIVDKMAFRSDSVTRAGVLLVSLNAIQVLTSDHLMYAVTGHGFVISALLIIALDNLGRKSMKLRRRIL